MNAAIERELADLEAEVKLLSALLTAQEGAVVLWVAPTERRAVDAFDIARKFYGDMAAKIVRANGLQSIHFGNGGAIRFANANRVGRDRQVFGSSIIVVYA